jgi:hypothetical protein
MSTAPLTDGHIMFKTVHGAVSINYTDGHLIFKTVIGPVNINY